MLKTGHRREAEVDQLDRKIAAIQKSTRTLLPLFLPFHDRLRMRSKLYYKWHLVPYHDLIHYSALIVAVCLSAIISLRCAKVPTVKAAASTCYWVGGAAAWDASNTASWASSSGGTPSTCDGGVVPGSDDIVIFDGSSGSGTVTLGAAYSPTVVGITLNTANIAIDLNSSTLTVSASSSTTFTFNAGTVNNGTLTISGGVSNIADFNGGTFDSDVNVTTGFIYLDGATFNGTNAFQKTGNGADLCAGGNTFGPSSVTTFSFHILARNNWALATTTGNTYNGNIIITNTGSNNSLYIADSDASAISTLASGKTITVDTFNAGLLYFYGFNQEGSTAQTIALTSSATVCLNDNTTFNGNLTLAAPGIVLGPSTFNGGTNVIRKTGTASNTSPGGATFGDSSNTTFYFNASTTNDWVLAGATGNHYNGNLLLETSGGDLFVAGDSPTDPVSTLADGKTVGIGPNGFASRFLYFYAFVQEGSMAQVLMLTGTANLRFYGGTEFGGALTVTAPTLYFYGGTFNGNVTVSSATPNINGANFNGATNSFTKTGTGSINNTGNNTFGPNTTSTFIQSSTGTWRFANTNPDTFGSVTFQNNSTGTFQVAYAEINNFAGDLTLTAGSGTITVGASGGTARFIKTSGTQALSQGAITIPKLTHNGAGTLQLSSNLTSTTVVNSSGTLDLNGYDLQLTAGAAISNDGNIVLAGNESLTNVTNLDIDSGTVTYKGNNTTNTYAIKDFGGTDYKNLAFTDANANKITLQVSDGNALTLAGNLTLSTGSGFFDNSTYDEAVTVANDVTMDNARTDMGDAVWTVSGSFDNGDVNTWNADASTVVFTATSGGKNITSNSAAFYNLTFDGTGGVWTLQNDLDQSASGSLAFTHGNLALNDHRFYFPRSFSLTIGNGFTLDIGTGTFQSDGNVYFYVEDGATVTASTPSSDNSLNVNTFEVTGTGIFTCSGAPVISAAGSIDISSSGWTPGNSLVRQYYSTRDLSATQPLYDYAVGMATNDYNVSVTLQGNLIAQHNFSIIAGTGGTRAFNSGIHDINVGGDWNVSGGMFAHSSNSITFDGSGAQAINNGTNTFDDLSIANTGATVSLSGNAGAVATFSVANNAAFDLNGQTMSISDSCDNDGTITVGNATLNIGGAADFNHVLNIADGTVNADGTWDGTGSTITFTGAGNLAFSNVVTAVANTLTSTTGTVTYDRNDNQTVDSGVTYYNLTIDNSDSGVATQESGTLNIDGNLLINDADAELTAANGGAIQVAGNWTNNGIFNASSGTIECDGGGTAILTTGGTGAGQTFYNLSFKGGGILRIGANDLKVDHDLAMDGAAGTFDNATNDKAITVANDVSMDNGTVSMGDAAWTVSGNFQNNHVDTFNPDSSTLIMNGNNANLVLTNTEVARGLHNFNIPADTTINVAAASLVVYIKGTAEIYGTLNISSDEIVTIISNADMRVKTGGKVTGLGTLAISNQSKLSEKNGMIDVGRLQIRGSHDDTTYPIVPATYEATDTEVFNSESVDPATWQTSIGTYIFDGNVLFKGNVDNTGSYTVDASASDTNLIFKGNVTFDNGTSTLYWTRGDGAITIGGTGTQSLNFLGKTIEDVNVTNTSNIVTFATNGFTSDLLAAAPDASLEFAAGQTFAFGSIDLSGEADHMITLASTVGDSYWLLNVSDLSPVVTCIDVTDSNASGGSEIDASDGTNHNGGHNLNWDFGVLPPNSPADLAQLKTDDTTLEVGEWTGETAVKYAATVSDGFSMQVQLCVEKDPVGTAFSGSEDGCGLLTDSGNTASYTVESQTDQTQYHWQARAKNSGGFYSDWVVFGGNNDPDDVDYGIDNITPFGGGVYDGSELGVDTDYNDGFLTTLAANWSGVTVGASGLEGYKYAIGTTAGGADIKNWTGNGTDTSFSENSLALHTGQMYYIAIRTTSNAGLVATPIVSDGIAVTPTLTFAITGGSTVAFDILGVDNDYTDNSKTTILDTSTNAYEGYIVYAHAGDELRVPARIESFIAHYASPNDTPTTWSGTGFGYTTSDTDLSGGVADRFTSGGPKYAGWTESAPGDPVADHAAPVSGVPIVNEQFTIGYRVTADAATAAGSYQTLIMYTCVPKY